MKKRTLKEIMDIGFKHLLEKAPERHSKETPECMSIPEMVRYIRGDETIMEKYREHYKKCPGYCQKQIRRFREIERESRE